MIGIYFSGTGNSRYAVELFCNQYDKEARTFSIEEDNVIQAVEQEELLGKTVVEQRVIEKYI